MPYLLLGPDDFSKKQFIDSLVEKQRADLVIFRKGDSLPTLSSLSQTDLFSKAKVFWFSEVVPDYLSSISNLSETQNRVVVSIKNLDKRLSENKILLTNKNITVKDFPLPTGEELVSWIVKRVLDLGGSIEKEAGKKLAFCFEGLSSGGYGYTPEYSLWEVEMEIQKLLAFSENKSISTEAVKNLATGESEINVFKISEAITSKNIVLAEKLISEFFEAQNTSDYKTGILQLSAILADQFRNMLAVKNLQKAGQNEESIAKIAGWKKVARVSVMSRLASGFTEEKIKSFLEKLSLLDREVKMSASPPRAVFDLILSQLMV